MKLITWRQPSKRSRICESQARFLAARIRSLVAERERALHPEASSNDGQAELFCALPAYELFCDAAYACGFVCDDFAPRSPLNEIHRDPESKIGAATLTSLRQYVHTLLRAERNNLQGSGYSMIFDAVNSGALLLVATRLEGDKSLYEE